MDVSIGLPHFVLLPGMCVDECCQGCAAGLRWMKLSSEERRASASGRTIMLCQSEVTKMWTSVASQSSPIALA